MFELVYDRKEYSDSFPERSEFCNTVCGVWEGGRSETGMTCARARARERRRSGDLAKNAGRRLALFFHSLFAPHNPDSCSRNLEQAFELDFSTDIFSVFICNLKVRLWCVSLKTVDFKFLARMGNP